MTFDEWFEFQQYTSDHRYKVFARVAWEAGASEASKEIAKLRTERDDARRLLEQSQTAEMRLFDRAEKSEQERDALAAVVERCEATFWRYVETHLTKGTDDGNRKAEANRQLADMCAATNYADILAARDARVRSEALREAPSVEAAEAMGAKGGETVQDERLAFEAWMRGHCWSLCSTWNGETYTSDTEKSGGLDLDAIAVRRTWAAWRDRAALSRKMADAIEKGN